MIHFFYIKHLSKSAPLILIAYLGCFYSHAQHLDSLKVEAAENNLALKAQYKSFEAELENVTQAKAWQDPNLSFGYFISPIETRVGPQIARFSLTQMLPWFGTFKANGNIASYKAEAEFEKFQDQKLKLFLKVAKQYYELVAIKVNKQLEAEQLELLEDLKLIMKANYENNQVQLIDVLRVDLEIDKQKTAIEVLKEQEQIRVTQLNQLMNRPLKTPVEIIKPKQVLEERKLMKIDSIPTEHPRLQRIRHLKASNNAKEKLAQKQALPQFGVGLDYVIVQDRNVMTADAGQDALMPMLSLSLPIFGKINTSRKKQAQLEGESLQFQLEHEKTRLQSDIQMAKYEYNELERSVALHEQQMQKLDDILQLSEVALANAKIDIEEVLRLYEEHLLHHKMKIRTLVELQKTQEKLNYLTLN